MIKRIISRLSFCTISQNLRNLQFRPSLALFEAEVFIKNYQAYVPYVGTITKINQLIKKNNFQYKPEYIKALLMWKYLLPDIVPLCKRIIENKQITQEELDLFVMTLTAHPHETQIVNKLLEQLNQRVENNALSIQDSKRINILSRINPKVCQELSYKIHMKLYETNNPEQLSRLLVNFTFKNTEKSVWSKQQKELKKLIATKMTKQTINQLQSLNQRETGQIIGNLILSTNSNEQGELFFTGVAQANLKTEQQFIRFINLIQQFIHLLSQTPNNVDNNTLKRALEILQIKKERFRGNAKVQELLIQNRYFVETVLMQPKEFKFSSKKSKTDQ